MVKVPEIAADITARIYQFEGLSGECRLTGSTVSVGLLLSLALERACELVQAGEEHGQSALELVAAMTLGAEVMES